MSRIQCLRCCWYTNVSVDITRDEDPTFFYTDLDPDPAQLEKYSGSGSDSESDLKSK